MRQIISGGAVSKMYWRGFICHCNAAVSLPGQGPPLSFFLLFCPVRLRRFWLGSAGSWTLCFLTLWSPVLHLPGLHSTVFCIENQRHQWDQYQDWPALPVWIQCSRKFTNSPSPVRHSSHTITRRRKILECQWLRCFSPCAPNHSQNIYHLSAASVRQINLKLNQSPSAQASKLSWVCVCVCVCVCVVCVCVCVCVFGGEGGRLHSDSLQRIVKSRSCQASVSKYICRQICFCMTCVFCLSIWALRWSYNSASDNDHFEEVLSWKS